MIPKHLQMLNELEQATKGNHICPLVKAQYSNLKGLYTLDGNNEHVLELIEIFYKQVKG